MRGSDKVTEIFERLIQQENLQARGWESSVPARLERVYHDCSRPIPEFTEEQIQEVLHRVDRMMSLELAVTIPVAGKPLLS